jgi:hypothetical protein
MAFKISAEVPTSSNYNSGILFPLLCEFGNQIHPNNLPIKQSYGTKYRYMVLSCNVNPQSRDQVPTCFKLSNKVKIKVKNKMKLQLIFCPIEHLSFLQIYKYRCILSLTYYHSHTHTKQVIWNIVINAYKSINHSYHVNNICSILL